MDKIKKVEVLKNLNQTISQLNTPSKDLLELGLQIVIRDYLKEVA